MLHSKTSTAARFTAHISPSQTSSSVPASNQSPTAPSPSLDGEDVTIAQSCRSDRRVEIEQVASLVAHGQRPAPLGGQPPGDKLTSQLRHGAFVGCHYYPRQEVVARVAEQIDPHGRTPTPSGWIEAPRIQATPQVLAGLDGRLKSHPRV